MTSFLLSLLFLHQAEAVFRLDNSSVQQSVKFSFRKNEPRTIADGNSKLRVYNGVIDFLLFMSIGNCAGVAARKKGSTQLARLMCF